MKSLSVQMFKGLSIAALLIASATFVACSSDNDIISENQQPVNPTGKYTMTINASKGDGATTRALTPGTDTETGKNTLNASWSTTENVYVQKGSEWATGSLQPQEDGVSTTLKGELSGITINADDELALQFPKSGDITYAGQLGTLDDIQANFDWATASVEVESVSASGNINPKTATTTFTNHQAIIKFTLKDKANDAAISPSALTVTDGTSTVELTSIPAATYTANGGDNNVLYVAFPAAGSAKTITLTATVGDDTYTYETATAKTFVNGQYYEITVKMTKYVPECSYTAPTLVGSTLTYNGSAQALVTGGSATNATIYYSTDGSSWNTSVPTGTNAGNYTVYYKVEPADGYTGGVASTSLGTKTINKANGWCSLSPSSSAGWFNIYDTSTRFSTISHHGGALSYSKSGSNSGNVDVDISGSTLILTKKAGDAAGTTVTVTSAATTNYNAASATYICAS